jgi:beta-xylosidase
VVKRFTFSRRAFLAAAAQPPLPAAVPLVATYANPLDVKVADPHILRDGDAYYLYGTGGMAHGRQGIPVWSSADLVHWTFRGLAWTRDADTWGQFWFWGPEVHKTARGYLMYFGCFRKVDGKNVGRIGTARSDSPLGPFRDLRTPMFEWAGNVIDFNLLVDDDGSAWAFPTMVGGGENAIYAARLAPDRLSLASTPVRVLGRSQPWEAQRIVEGAFTVKRDGAYYMLYSANHFRNPDYGVGYAVAKHPLGPWTKYEGNPIIRRRGPIEGPGCAALIASPDNRELFAYYHVHLSPEGRHRQLALDRLHFVSQPDGGYVLRCDGPTLAPVPLPSGAVGHQAGVTDAFAAPALDRTRWMIVDEDPAHWRYRPGALEIDLQVGDMAGSGGDYRNLFLQYAPRPDFDIRAKAALPARADGDKAFLCVWQDHDNFVRVSATFEGGRQLEASHELARAYEASSIASHFGDSLHLRIEKRGDVFSSFASDDGAAWTTVGKPFRAALHNIRVGFGAIASRAESSGSARFHRFEILP